MYGPAIYAQVDDAARSIGRKAAYLPDLRVTSCNEAESRVGKARRFYFVVRAGVGS